MASQTLIPRFRDGHRVRVVLLRGDDESTDFVPAHHRKYHGMIGYIAETKHAQSYIRSLHYEVFITRIGINLTLLEEHLESADSRRSVP